MIVMLCFFSQCVLNPLEFCCDVDARIQISLNVHWKLFDDGAKWLSFSFFKEKYIMKWEVFAL